MLLQGDFVAESQRFVAEVMRWPNLKQITRHWNNKICVWVFIVLQVQSKFRYSGNFFPPVITTVRVCLILSEITPLRHISVFMCSGVSRDLAPVADKVAVPEINYEP